MSLATSTTDLSLEQAKNLTEQIRTSGESLRTHLLAAYDGKAWKVMGYSGWPDYLAHEFDVSRSNAWKLIHTARSIKVLASAAQIAEADVALTVNQATQLGPKGVEEVVQRVADRVSPDEPVLDRSAALRDEVAEGLAAKRAVSESKREPHSETVQSAERNLIPSAKAEQGAKTLQLIMELDPAEVARAYLSLTPDRQVIGRDEIGKRLGDWTWLFSEALGS
jgi:hypothetical protein